MTDLISVGSVQYPVTRTPAPCPRCAAEDARPAWQHFDVLSTTLAAIALVVSFVAVRFAQGRRPAGSAVWREENRP